LSANEIYLSMRKNLLLLFLFIIVIQTGKGVSKQLINADALKPSVSFQNLNILTDSSNTYTFEDVRSGKYDSMFKPLMPQKTALNAFTHYWIRFRIKNNSYENLLMFHTYNRFKEAILFMPKDSDKYLVYQSGLSKPFRDWYIRTNYIVFPLLFSNSNKYYYMKIMQEYSREIEPNLFSTSNFINQSVLEHFAKGVFYGIVLAAFLYSLVFFGAVKEKAYLYYSLYVVSFALFAFVDFGTIINFIYYTGFRWQNDLYTIPFVCMTICLLQYARYFLELKNSMPKADRLISALVILRIVIFLLGSLFQIEALYNPYIDNAILSVAFVLAIIRYKKGYLPARYFMLGFSVLFAGLIPHTLEYLRILNYHVNTVFTMYQTGTTEMILFSFALADRFRILKREKDTADKETMLTFQENNILQKAVISQLKENEVLKDNINKELEAKVRERTLELELANQQIQQMNVLLEEDNKKLEVNIKTISRKRVMDNRVTFDEFQEIYPNEESCYKFLEELKWNAGFTCIKCGNDKWSKGNTRYSRRCSKCNHIETLTTATIFERTKIPIRKAFYMLFLIGQGKNISSDELSHTLEIRKQTCWAFKKKVEQTLIENPKLKKNKDGWSHLILVHKNNH
jgi:two-component system, sensor histidine kinase LadS